MECGRLVAIDVPDSGILDPGCQRWAGERVIQIAGVADEDKGVVIAWRCVIMDQIRVSVLEVRLDG